jgi:hypothetical protein
MSADSATWCLGSTSPGRIAKCECLNSWALTGAPTSHRFLSQADLERLLFSSGGEAWSAVELL